jgi:hypothetical protein
MRTSVLVGSLLLGSFYAPGPSAAQTPPNPEINRAIAAEPLQKPATNHDQVIERMIAREKEGTSTFTQYSPIIETYIQEVRPDKVLGIVPKADFYFLGQADFRGRLKVHTLQESEKKGNWMWSFNPAGFLQMVFIDRGQFDKIHYRFDYVRREFLGEVRCYVFDVTPAPKARGARFVGRIWVEDRDMTIVRVNGTYTPAIHFSLKTFEDEYYLHFDSWRENVRPGLWLPSYVFTEQLDRPKPFSGPPFKSITRLWGYGLTPVAQESELSRLLVESPSMIKEEASEHDRSPVEAQRDWRHVAEINILDLLERNGLLAPPGGVDKVLDAIVKNLEIANNLENQADLHCRVLLTTNLEMFSVGNTIVLSRGMIDVVPDEATMAAMLANGMADAMVPKPYLEQYAFSDIMRLTATEVLKRLSFENGKTEAADNSSKAMELLNKSPYASQLDKAGLFLAQLHSQSKQLKRLISPQLGNEVYFNSQLMQAAPALQPNDKNQIAALPLGSRLKIDPWSAAVSLRKSPPTTLLSPRDKMPFEITPMVPYLIRYGEMSSSQPKQGSDLFGGLN